MPVLFKNAFRGAKGVKKVRVLVVQSCPTLSYPVDCSPPGSSIHGILQARISTGWQFLPAGDLSDPGIEPRSPALAGRFFAVWATRETQGVILCYFHCGATHSRHHQQ